MKNNTTCIYIYTKGKNFSGKKTTIRNGPVKRTETRKG